MYERLSKREYHKAVLERRRPCECHGKLRKTVEERESTADSSGADGSFRSQHVASKPPTYGNDRWTWTLEQPSGRDSIWRYRQAQTPLFKGLPQYPQSYHIVVIIPTAIGFHFSSTAFELNNDAFRRRCSEQPKLCLGAKGNFSQSH